MSRTLYNPADDTYYKYPYIDIEEWRDQPVRHYFVHGGFRGTEENGTEVRFAFYFPEKERYEGRFYQYLSPAPEYEREVEALHGEEDKIAFCCMHGAYLVVSNQGGFQMNDPTRLFKASSNAAEFSRKVACRFYETEKRPYGYCFGGSGGSFKAIGCLENTEGIWDGGVPYVIANPMGAPNNFVPRARVMRVLGAEGIAKVVDSMEPGGSGDIYSGLNDDEVDALKEATRMGFPKRAWFAYPDMSDGALPVLTPYIYSIAPEYFTDFWTKPGYAGADPKSREARDRVQFRTTVTGLVDRRPRKDVAGEETAQVTNVDNSWQAAMDHSMETPGVTVAELPPADAYMVHARLRILTGAAAGKSAEIDHIEGNTVIISNPAATMMSGNLFEALAVGDEVMIDNSDYIAMSMLVRHQVPDARYDAYDQFRKEDGTPAYPQLPTLVALAVALNGGGSIMDGDFHGKMLAVCSLLDESAFPWHGIWYRNEAEKKAREQGRELSDSFRLYYNDNCLHGDAADELSDPEHQVDYTGVLHQALLDVAAWVEKGIEPLPSTEFDYSDGQFTVSDDAAVRKGLQPIVELRANKEKCIHVKAGEKVVLTGTVTAPPKSGIPVLATIDYEGDNHFVSLELTDQGNNDNDCRYAVASTEHVYDRPGTYFAVMKACSTRNGDREDIFIRCKNLSRVRIIVE